ncbi:DDE-type integrase/transposase/recombinase [Leptolyngbya sp. FACHB-671]|uniref:Mu transposase C-terminal domain-containing protein n=1 Tax=Leptolyngbya sp. FACHB-671 TaxID=2692812 RepID=UPI0016876B1B|nr:Mu transposase C-terminal domain-containing protein [Leptolyngbya sp. FACHB-671]MBD2070352.1 DDE-type integrase/transposase/recombinase [Leptolyngbya sp. FACHB-671]
MKNLIYVNDLIEWNVDEVERSTERVLWIDKDYTIALVIDIFAKTGFPTSRKIVEIVDALSEGQAKKTSHDPFIHKSLVEEVNLSESERTIRDKAWDIISTLVEPKNEPSIYYKSLRGSMIRSVVDNFNAGKNRGSRQEKNGERITEKTVYTYLRRYWQRGKTINALLPDYCNSGGPGKIKKAGEKKRGRPRKYATLPEIGEGRNIDEADRRIFRVSINYFYETSKKNPLKTAYKLMLKAYYTEEIYCFEDGSKKTKLISPGERPTFTQFKYWYEQELDIEKALIRRKGEKTYLLENRAVLGTSTAEVIGPGSRFQIDATVADVYIVSSYNPNWIVGRPVVYVVIDVFSRMIVGVYVGLEGPSWLGAMMALVNTATNKIPFCEEYGISITDEEWSCCHLPYTLLADRGELLGTPIETLSKNLHVKIENTASYRADWKGIVERRFRTIHGHVKPFVPGYIDVDFRKRGGKDYRLDGKLTIKDFTKIIIKCILHHNNRDYIESYSRQEMMVADNVQTIPAELWKWGIRNRSGRLRSFPEDIIKLNLLPRDRGTVTSRGIRFKGMSYTCEKAIKQRWFEKARNSSLDKESKYLGISYDLRQPNFIYIRDVDGRGFEKCFLLDSEERYLNKSIEEVEHLHQSERLDRKTYESDELQHDVDLATDIEEIVAEAEKRSEPDCLTNLS